MFVHIIGTCEEDFRNMSPMSARKMIHKFEEVLVVFDILCIVSLVSGVLLESLFQSLSMFCL
jgi:hypothetical protein